jgi:pyrimidine-nucleoside phosphorylase
MISGRGLGHTGGTLDKLESIPGFSTNLSVDRFREGVARVGTAMIGQTDSLAPADKKLYALRDVTGTVESIPLISASIMSKKLAEGISGLVLDVKVGSGAFMKTLDQARELGRKLVAIGTGNGVRTLAFLTDMNQPLGWAVGNSLEVRESIEILRGQGPEDTTELTVTFGGAMLWLGGAVSGLEEGRRRIRAAMTDGSGLAKFREMVAFQGGDPAVADEPDRLPTARFTEPVAADRDGFVVRVDTEKVGMACVLLGGGRRRKEDAIDPAVGFRIHARLGSRVRKGEPLVSVHHQGGGSLAEVTETILAAYGIADLPVPAGPLVIETIR